jgi:hypothetical protein
LGEPVVPDVYIRNATSSGPVVTLGSSAEWPATQSSNAGQRVCSLMATTVSTVVSRSSIVSTCPKNSEPTTRAFAFASSTMCSISGAANRQFTGTPTAPNLASPQMTSKNSAPFFSM